jgi:DNA-binding PadR family transcriptional regulator
MAPGSPDAAVTAFLPLRPVEYHVLLSLSDRPRHGYGIMQDAEDRSGSAVIPDVATLYRALKRMVEGGLIRPAEGRAAGDRRRTDYEITSLGARVARAESRRMATLVEAAAGAGLLRG